MVELDVCGWWDTMIVVVEHVRRDFAGGTLTTEDASSDANRPHIAYIISWVIRSVGLFIEGFENCDRFSTVIIEEIGS
jgi:hypothetical protein